MSLKPDLETGLAGKGSNSGDEIETASLPVLPVPAVKRRPNWVPRLLFKHEHVIAEDNSIQSDGFRLGAMSDDDFCQWVPRAPKRVQNAVVRHVTWWRSKKAPLHHQFVILTLRCAPAERYGAPDGGEANEKGKQEGALYDICLERIGKGMGFKALAEHRVTITPSKYLKTYEEESTLLFGLISDDATYLSQITPPSSHTVPVTFTDELDIKWRGPPATLRHVAAYVYAIVHLSPRYSLASTNCYYFARLIVHLIALRHHSFPYFAASDEQALKPPSERLDPSSIGTMFQFLDTETKVNGTLLYSRFRSAVCIVFATAMTTGFIYGLVRMFMALPTRASKIVMAFVVFFVMLTLYLELLHYAVIQLTKWMVVPFWNMMNSHTEKVIVALDNNPELTNPLGKRGNYIRVKTWVPDEGTDEKGFRRLKERDGPREAVSPWERPEQVYVPPDD